MMNKHPFVVALLILMFACITPTKQNVSKIKFERECYDFGNIPFKKEVTYTFEFTNIGKTMVIINDVKTSCGCTDPKWAKKPIRPGEKGEIIIKYDAAFSGVFQKTIEVIYNGTDSPRMLEIRGIVDYPNLNTK